MKVKNENAMYIKKTYFYGDLIRTKEVNYTKVLKDIEPFQIDPYSKVKSFKLNKYGYRKTIKVFDMNDLMYEYEFIGVQGATKWQRKKDVSTL